MSINIKGSALPATSFVEGDAVPVDRSGTLTKITLGDFAARSMPGSTDTPEDGDTILAERDGALVRLTSWLGSGLAAGNYGAFSVDAEGFATIDVSATAVIKAGLAALDAADRGAWLKDMLEDLVGEGEIPTVTADSIGPVVADPMSEALASKEVAILVFDDSQDVTTGDGAGDVFFRVPITWSGAEIVSVGAQVQTAGTTGTTDIQIARKRVGGSFVDVLTTKITIDSGETDSSTAAASYVINTSNDDLVTGDQIRIDVDATSTTKAKGLVVTIVARFP